MGKQPSPFFTVNCWKDKNKEKEARYDPFKNISSTKIVFAIRTKSIIYKVL